MEKIHEVLKGKKIYPKLNNKYIKLSITIDMKESYSIIFGNIDYDEFISKIKANKKYRNEVVSRIFNYFKLDDFKLISSSDYNNWYFVKLVDKMTNNYSLLYVESVCHLNPNHFYEDYTDLFGNKVKFSE